MKVKVPNKTFFISMLSIFLLIGCYHSDKPTNQYLSLLAGVSMDRRITIVGDSLGQWSDGFGLKQNSPLDLK